MNWRSPRLLNNTSLLRKTTLGCSVLAGCCLLATPGWAEPELKGTPPELAVLLTNVPQTVQVTGEAELKVEADRAIITVKVTTTARELATALRTNQQLRDKFISRLAAAGIGSEQVKASKFSSTEKYGVFSDKVKSHRVDHLLKVTARSEKEFQVVADAIDNLPEAQYLGVEFERSDKEEMRAKAVAQACDNATLRKQAFEQKLGLKLSVRRFLDLSGTPVALPQPLFGVGSQAVGFSGSYNAALPRAGSAPSVTLHALAEREGDSTGFGELTFRACVTVEYRVESK